VLFAQRLQTAGPVPLRQSRSVLDLVIEHADVFTLREATRKVEPPSPPHSTAVTEFLGGGLNKNPTPGVDRHVLNSSTRAACRIWSTFWAFQNQRPPRYRTQGVIKIMLSRARYCWPGSN